jgi:hypothetical protein
MHWTLVAYVAIGLVALLFLSLHGFLNLVHGFGFRAAGAFGVQLHSSVVVSYCGSLFCMDGMMLDLFGPSHAASRRFMLAFPNSSAAITIPFSPAKGWYVVIWLDWATIQFRFFGPASRYTGSFCVFGPVLSSPAHGP